MVIFTLNFSFLRGKANFRFYNRCSMYLQKLSLINFKNYREAEFAFSEGVNCFAGNNGVGKTNLLDAIHYLSFCKSFFNPIDSQNILHGEDFFVIQGTFASGKETDEVYCGLKRNQKKQFKRNKKEYSRLADHIGLFPVVMISPADADLINDGSESRRKFIDSVISQFDRNYLDNLIQYNKVLLQRNALLKSFADNKKFDKNSLEVWDLQMIDYGKKIHEKRKEFMEMFSPFFQKHYELVSGAEERVDLEYVSQLNQSDFRSMLEEVLRKDRIVQYSTVGIHKDDLAFKINGYPVKKYGSQGQQKSYLIALKLAQFDFIKKMKKITPVLLLDDIYDKLDESRMKHLMNLVSNDNFGQIFITDTHQDRIAKLFKNDKNIFRLFKINNEVVSS